MAERNASPDAKLLQPVASELILGGQKSGKSARAEQLARSWLQAQPAHHAVLIATAQARDAEMRARIERHRQDRARRVPAMETLEWPHDLPAAILAAGGANTLRIVDCLTLWLVQEMWPEWTEGGQIAPDQPGADTAQRTEALLDAIARCPGPVVLVSNELGLGVIPMGREARQSVDALGLLNQAVARVCQRVSFMVAGIPWIVKGAA